MSRSFGNGLARAIVRGIKETEREGKRIHKAQQRALEKQVREQNKIRTKINKERYTESRIDEAINLTEKLIDDLDEYNDIVRRVMYSVPSFRFEYHRDIYKQKQFVFNESKPEKRSPKILEVPDESWLDKIISSRVTKRNNIIENNEKEVERVRLEYEQSLEQYNLIRHQEYESWLVEEERRKEEVVQNNEELDKWEEKYYKYDEEAVSDFIDASFASNRHFGEVIKEIDSSYNKHSKTAIIEIHMKNKDDIFPFEGYKYLKTRDLIEPIKMKVNESTKRLKELMLNIAISSFYIVLKNTNTEKDIVEVVIVNVFHEGICCISGKVTNEQLKEINLNTRSNYYAFLDNHIRVMKQLARGVNPLERIYVHLE